MKHIPLDRNSLPQGHDLASWLAFLREHLNVLQHRQEELFASFAACLEPDATTELAGTLMPKAILINGTMLELMSIAHGIEQIVRSQSNEQPKRKEE